MLPFGAACSFICVKLLNEFILLKIFNLPDLCLVLMHLSENCAGCTIDFTQMSKIVFQQGNEFLQPARVDDSPGTVELHRRSSLILVPQLCMGQILNIFPVGLFFGASAGLGCRRDRKTGGFYLH